mmetsp:Transcript_19815/g.26131  ORF Transcript_19815/g.26131 Transcript_19815/m.26131 type:complete len:214 (+) Transcript_19815:217-858(+)
MHLRILHFLCLSFTLERLLLSSAFQILDSSCPTSKRKLRTANKFNTQDGISVQSQRTGGKIHHHKATQLHAENKLKFWTPPQKISKENGIIDIKGEEHLKETLQDLQNNLIILRFHAQFCYSCSIVGKKCEKLALKYADFPLKFLDIDVSDPVNEDLKNELNISVIPTVLFLKGQSQVLEEFVCTPSSVSMLSSKLEKHLGLEGSSEDVIVMA